MSADPRAASGLTTAPSDEARRAMLMAARLRHNATPETPLPGSRVSSFALEHAVAGDIGHLHAAYDLRLLPIVSRRRLAGSLIVRLKRVLRQGLHPLPEAQSVWNGANVRVITFLLGQLAAQAYAIESLERQLAELRDERRSR